MKAVSILVGILGILFVPVAVFAEDPATRLQDVRHTLRAEEARQATAAAEAAEAETALAALQEESVALAATLQTLEDELATLVAESERIAAAIGVQEQELTTTATAQEEVLASLVQLSRKPPPAVLLRAGGAAEAARAAAVMDALLNDAAAKSAVLRLQVQQLQTLRQQSAAVQADRQAHLAELAAQRDTLGTALDRKRALLAKATAAETAAAGRVRTLAAQARSLEDLMTGLNTPIPPPPPQRTPERTGRAAPPAPLATPVAPSRRFASTTPPRRGALNRPVSGKIATRFGQTGRFKSRSRGITWQVAAESLVIAPWGGEVAYAGPFRGYGNIVILKHRGSYYSVVAGLGRIVVQQGQRLTSGEPLGQMGRTAARSELYLEFRRHDTPIDPLPWLAQARSGS